MIATLCLLVGLSQNDGTALRVELKDINTRLAGKRIIVEGIYSALGNENRGTRLMQLKGSNVNFLVPISLLLRHSPTGNLDIVGVVENLSGKPVVQVEELRLLPTDNERFDKQFKEAGDKVDRLLALADWADKRHQQYGDKQMQAAALQAYKRAVEIRKQEAGNDPEKLAALGVLIRKESRWRDYDLDALDHEILRAEFDRVKPNDVEALAAFIESVRSRLPGADEASKPLETRERRDYDLHSNKAYSAASASVRKSLARYFYATLVAKELELKHELNEAPPFDLAEQAKKRIPEYREFARKWYREWIKAQEVRLLDLEPESVAEAAGVLEKEVQDFETASKLRLDWLDGRERKLAREEKEAAATAKKNGGVYTRDADAWFELAQVRGRWFPKQEDQREKVAKTLIDVLSIVPGHANAEIELGKLGYVRTSTGEWKPKAAAPERPVGAAAMRRAVSENMSTDEVVAVLGKPNRVARIGTSVGVSHLWYYGTGNNTIIVVFAGKPGTLRVTRIHERKTDG